MLRPILVLFLLLVFTLPSRADQSADLLHEAEAARIKADYKTALKLLQPLAEQGNAEAQYWLGWIYQRDAAPANGEKGAESDAEAMKWWRKAAEQGNSDAESALGWMYLQGGPDRQRDKVEAAKWYRKAAEDGNTEAQIALSLQHIGLGLDRAEAEKWFRAGLLGYEKKADQGDSSAMSRLLSLYESEWPLPPDYEKAYFWCSVVAQKNSNNPNQHRGWIGPIDQRDADRLGEHLWFFQRYLVRKQVDEWIQAHPPQPSNP